MNRALPSALGQWYDHIEVIVVVDGPDPVTEQALAEAAAHDPRIRPVILPHNMGGSDARNAGVQAARGEWIAFLDDDDEWLPGKIEAQLLLGLRSSALLPVVSCAWLTRTDRDETQNMPRPLHRGESFGDYLLRRPGLNVRNHSLPSSTLMARAELFRNVPFTAGLFKHQDTDWLLLAGAQRGVALEIVPEIQMVYYRETGRLQMSSSQNWLRSLAWLRTHRDNGRLSNAACAGFLVSYLAPLAARTGDPATFFRMSSELLRFFPRPFEVLRFLAIWFVSPALRHRLLFAGSKKGGPFPTGPINPQRTHLAERPVYHATQEPSSDRGA